MNFPRNKDMILRWVLPALVFIPCFIYADWEVNNGFGQLWNDVRPMLILGLVILWRVALLIYSTWREQRRVLSNDILLLEKRTGLDPGPADTLSFDISEPPEKSQTQLPKFEEDVSYRFVSPI